MLESFGIILLVLLGVELELILKLTSSGLVRLISSSKKKTILQTC